jgi:hypothetical protein
MAEQNKNELHLVGIVAVVAIVGIVLLVIMAGRSSAPVSYQAVDAEAGNIAGEAMSKGALTICNDNGGYSFKGVNLDSGNTFVQCADGHRFYYY